MNLDGLTVGEWNRFEQLYQHLDQSELLRKGDQPRGVWNDAYFLDKDDQVVKVVRNIPPWRLVVWGGRRATKVLETAVQ